MVRANAPIGLNIYWASNKLPKIYQEDIFIINTYSLALIYSKKKIEILQVFQILHILLRTNVQT